MPKNWEIRVSSPRKSAIASDRHARERSRRTLNTRNLTKKRKRETRASPCTRTTSKLGRSRRTRIRRKRRRAVSRISPPRSPQRTRWKAPSSSLRCKRSQRTMLRERNKERRIKKRGLKADSIEISNRPNTTTNRLSGSSCERHSVAVS